MNVDLKTGIFLAGLLMSGAGFYYNTQSRLDGLEAKVVKLEKQVGKLRHAGKGNRH